MASSKSPSSAVKAGNELVSHKTDDKRWTTTNVIHSYHCNLAILRCLNVQLFSFPSSLSFFQQLQRYRKEKVHQGDSGELLNNMLFGGSPPRGHGSRDLTMSPYYDANAAGAASGEAKKYTPVLGGAGGGIDVGNTSTISLSTRLQTPKEIDQSHSRLGQRSMLKVYMANQLELNEAEMAEYEEVVNELAQQLEDMTVERDELVSYTHQLTNEKEEQLRLSAQQYAEEKSNLLGKIHGLEGMVGETKLLFVEMGVEGEDLGTRRQFLRDLRVQVAYTTSTQLHTLSHMF